MELLQAKLVGLAGRGRYQASPNSRTDLGPFNLDAILQSVRLSNRQSVLISHLLHSQDPQYLNEVRRWEHQLGFGDALGSNSHDCQ
jgi:hypothetical protein